MGKFCLPGPIFFPPGGGGGLTDFRGGFYRLLRRDFTVAVFLGPGDTKSGKAVVFQKRFPGPELVQRQLITPAGLFQCNQTAVNPGDDLGLAADHPAFRSRWRQIVKRHELAVGAERLAGLEPALVPAGGGGFVFCHRPLMHLGWAG